MRPTSGRRLLELIRLNVLVAGPRIVWTSGGARLDHRPYELLGSQSEYHARTDSDFVSSV